MTDENSLEREIVDRAREGDDDAFEDLVRMYQGKLYGYLWRLSGNVEEAMELTQSSFVKAYVSLKRFRGDSSFKTYLYRIATNSWRNSIRDRSRRRTIDIDQVAVSSGEDLHDDLQRQQDRDRLWRAVEGLPPRQKEALVLRVREGYPFDQVARIMGCSTGAAKASYHHAVQKLKTDLEGDQE